MKKRTLANYMVLVVFFPLLVSSSCTDNAVLGSECLRYQQTVKSLCQNTKTRVGMDKICQSFDALFLQWEQEITRSSHEILFQLEKNCQEAHRGIVKLQKVEIQ